MHLVQVESGRNEETRLERQLKKAARALKSSFKATGKAHGTLHALGTLGNALGDENRDVNVAHADARLGDEEEAPSSDEDDDLSEAEEKMEVN